MEPSQHSLVLWTREDLLLPGLYTELEDPCHCQPPPRGHTASGLSFFQHKFVWSLKVAPVLRSFQVRSSSSLAIVNFKCCPGCLSRSCHPVPFFILWLILRLVNILVRRETEPRDQVSIRLETVLRESLAIALHHNRSIFSPGSLPHFIIHCLHVHLKIKSLTSCLKTSDPDRLVLRLEPYNSNYASWVVINYSTLCSTVCFEMCWVTHSDNIITLLHYRLNHKQGWESSSCKHDSLQERSLTAACLPGLNTDVAC